jgi:hypothetical protein
LSGAEEKDSSHQLFLLRFRISYDTFPTTKRIPMGRNR